MDPMTAIGAGLSLVDTVGGWITGRDNMEKQAQLSYNQWKRQFDETNRYNTPANELKRYSQIGVNPFVTKEGATMFGKSMSGAVPQSVLPQFTPGFNFANSYNQVMNGLLLGSQTQGQNIQNTRLGDMLDAQKMLLIRKAGHEDLMNEYQKMANDVFQKTGEEHARAVVKNILEDTALKSSNILLNKDLSKEAANKALEALANKTLLEAKEKLARKDYDFFEQRFEIWKKEALAHVDTYKSESSKNYAQGQYYKEEAETERQIRSYKVNEKILENGIKAIDFMNKKEFDRDIQATQLATLIEQMEIAAKENNVYYFRFATEVLKAMNDGVMNWVLGKGLLKVGKGARTKEALQKQVKQAKESGNLEEGTFEHIDQLLKNKDKIRNDYGELEEILEYAAHHG